MPDLHYEHPRLAAIYDLANGWDLDREFYLSLAVGPRCRVLDFGCGTGLLANAYAERGHLVTAVDPSSAMLEQGRRRPCGAQIEWVQGEVQRIRTEQHFDLIVMTGHAFQVLLTAEDLTAALETMRRHLAPSGCIAFETRNPALDWASEWHGRETFYESPFGTIRERLLVRSYTQGRVEFETRYLFDDDELSSVSELRFWEEDEITQQLSHAGLSIRERYGDWHRTVFDRGSSREMIFVVGHVPSRPVNGRRHPESRQADILGERC